MHTAFLPPPSSSSETAAADNSPANAKSGTRAEGVAGTFGWLRSTLRQHLTEPADREIWHRLLSARRAAAQAIAGMPRQQKNGAGVDDVRNLLREIIASGIHDAPVDAADRELVGQLLPHSWSGLLAAMLLTPAWQWEEAPALQDVPEWLWGDYTAWLFAAPQGFTAPGQTARFAAHSLGRAEELLRWVQRNRGSAAVRSALAAYVAAASSIPLYFHEGSLKAHAVVRGRLLTAAHHRPHDGLAPLPRERAGRRLRIGFVNRHFGSQTETYTTLPTFEQLDPARFEVILYSLRANPGVLEDYARSRASQFQVLPDDIDEQLRILRAASLDVVVFGTNVTAVFNEVTRLALHRVAPLQVVNNSSCITSGLPEIDLYVSGAGTEAAGAETQFTERLGLLPGPAHAFNYQADAVAPTATPTRALLGLPEDAVVFVSAANFYKIIPEMQVAWARLLAVVPNSYLLIHPFNPNWSSRYPIARFCAEFDQVLAAHNVAGSRLVVSTVHFPSRSDVKELLRVGDVYLDTYPFGGVNSLVDPLELGLPVVTWEGDSFRSRMGSALLRELNLPELIATSEAEYHTLALKFATDPVQRETAATRVAAAMQSAPLFLDTLAASDAFGGLLETAFDELLLAGPELFRSTRTPLAIPGTADVESSLQSGHLDLSLGLPASALGQARRILNVRPHHPQARHLLGLSLMTQGNAPLAVDYLLAAVQNLPGDGGLWFDLARALEQQGRMPQAIQALRRALELDAQRLDAWLMLVELARRVGVMDLARDAFAFARQLGPEDARVKALAPVLGT